MGGSDWEGSVPDKALQGRAAEEAEREGSGEGGAREEKGERGCAVEALEGPLPSAADVHVQCQLATADEEQRKMSAEGQQVSPAVKGQRLE